MKQFINALDSLDLIIKIILAIPALDIIWSIYRICCALDKQDVVALVISVILLFIPITWIFDLVCLILNGRVWKYQA